MAVLPLSIVLHGAEYGHLAELAVLPFLLLVSYVTIPRTVDAVYGAEEEYDADDIKHDPVAPDDNDQGRDPKLPRIDRGSFSTCAVLAS